MPVKHLWLIMIKYFVIRNFRGTRLSVEMLKGHMVRERLGNPGLAIRRKLLLTKVPCFCSDTFVYFSEWMDFSAHSSFRWKRTHSFSSSASGCRRRRSKQQRPDTTALCCVKKQSRSGESATRSRSGTWRCGCLLCVTLAPRSLQRKFEGRPTAHCSSR